MTTKVVVTNTGPDKVRVRQVSVGSGSEVDYSNNTLGIDESTEQYVHSGARLIVEEVQEGESEADEEALEEIKEEDNG